ncbi:MAG: N-acetylmuramoyl-L-alanine amidase family protein [Oscillospiraceae bacterium]
MNKRTVIASALALVMAVSALPLCAGAAEITEKDGAIFCIEDDGSYGTGWKTIDGREYYFTKSGKALTKNTVINGIRYKFGSDGVCLGRYTGFAKSGGKYFYYLDGEKLTGWCSFSGGWRYFGEDGAMAVGTAEIYGKSYNFSEKGIWDGAADYSEAAIALTLDKRLSDNDYGGVYVNKGAVVVMAVNEDAVLKVVEKYRKKFAPIIIKKCEYSAAQLETVRKELGGNMKKYGISAIGTEIMKNRVVVNVKEVNCELRAYLDSIDHSGCVEIEEGEIIACDD